MYSKYLAILALAGTGYAQTPSLLQALNSTTDLSQLQGVLGVVPDIVAALGNATNITILAPSNTAFNRIDNATLQSLAANQELIKGVLQYHVLNGVYNSSMITNTSSFVPTMLTNPMFTNVTGGQVVKATRRNNAVTFYSGLLSNSSVSKADIAFSGGIIHIIDRLLVLPQSAPDSLAAAGLSSLRGALSATNLVDTVSSTPNITIFAPSNEAFRTIGSGLANLSTTQIADVLKYHVVASGPIGYSTALKNGTKLKTVNGAELTITLGQGGVFVNSARVTTADILIANGVLHVIDQVLNPAGGATPNTTATQGAPAFSGASAVSEAPYTSGQPMASTTIPADVTSAAADPTAPASTSSRAAAAGPMQTGAIGFGALLGAAAVYLM